VALVKLEVQIIPKNTRMKNAIFVIILAVTSCMPASVMADFNGSVYVMNSPYSLCVTNSSLTINSVVAGAYNVATLVVSNSSPNGIFVNWAAPGRAVGIGTTNQLLVPGGEIAQVNVNAAVPGMIIYSTQLEQIMPTNAIVTPLTPDLLYYELTEGSATYLYNGLYLENPPVYLADSSTHGGSTGTVTATVPIQWVPNQNGTPTSAIHFNGASTKITAGNPAMFNFTTNLFTVNIWVRNLTYPCAIIGNGLYLNYGWYVDVNPAGEIVVAAENPGVDKYVITTSTVAFAGQWSMITVVRTGPTTVQIYRNGLLQNTAGSFANPAPSSYPLLFGDDYAGNQYDGDLGTIRIYSRPLSASEINALYLGDTVP
jgi:hypothetical protein